MKKFLFFIFLIFIGCVNKEYIFVSTNDKCIKKEDIKIGVEIKLPYYMSDLEIMRLKDSKLIPTHKYLSKEISKTIIAKLSNKLCDPNIFLYPWGEEVKYKIDINIDNFYLKGKFIYLNGRIYINNKFFKVNVIKKCKNHYNCINEIFDEISNKIIKEIK